YYGHDAGGTRYSPLAQINRENVSKLKVAWTFHTGDISDGSQGRRRSGFENTPIMTGGTLYISTPFNRVIALDAVSGKQRWAYDPKIDLTWQSGDGLINRGVSEWRVEMASGVGRAFDARSGTLRWSWDPIPPNESKSGQGGGKTWRSGAANAWSIMAVDAERDLIFVPTGSASPDYYGGLRPGDDKW